MINLIMAVIFAAGVACSLQWAIRLHERNLIARERRELAQGWQEYYTSGQPTLIGNDNE